MPHTVNASEFRATCLRIMDRVAATGEPVVVTKRGRPIVRLTPVTTKPRTLRGFLKGRIRLPGAGRV